MRVYGRVDSLPAAVEEMSVRRELHHKRRAGGKIVLFESIGRRCPLASFIAELTGDGSRHSNSSGPASLAK